MAEVRTAKGSEVERVFADGKGVAVMEPAVQTRSGSEFRPRFTVWFREAPGLRKGDRAQFYGQLSVSTREHQGKVFAEAKLNDAQVLGEVERAPEEDASAGAWETASPGEGAWS